MNPDEVREKEFSRRLMDLAHKRCATTLIS